MTNRVNFQFSIRSMLLVMAGFALFCGLLSWLGVVILIWLGTALAMFLGMLAGQYVGLDTCFEDIRWDIAKCVFLAALFVFTAWFFLTFDVIPPLVGRRLLLPLVIVHAVLVKLCWMDYGSSEVSIMELSALVGVFVSASAAHAFFGG